MKVYALLEFYPYEGTTLLGIYASVVTAETEAKKQQEDEHYIEYYVKEYDLIE